MLDLDSEDGRCQGQSIYGAEFLLDVVTHYEKLTPREEVDAESGKYLFDCGEWTAGVSEGVFQSCYYDFGGEGELTLIIRYQRNYPDPFDSTKGPTEDAGGKVWRVGIDILGR